MNEEDNKRFEDLEERVERNEHILLKLVKDVMKFWHIGLGLGLGLVVEKFGLDKLISKFL